MRRLSSIVGIELLAIALAVLQWTVGVRTDEAKYLLDIPYPHPPAVRFVLSLLSHWEYQELFWRIVLASLVLNGVWLVWDLARGLSRNQRLIVSLSWILSSAVLLQAGTVMMAPLTALQLLVFLWLQSRPEIVDRHRGCVALFWLFSLFTAYQAVLFLPLVTVLFWRVRGPILERIAYITLPLVVLALYTLSNPLAAASLLGRSHGEAASLMVRVWQFGNLWLIAGSGVTSLLGTIGVLRSRQWPLIVTFLLVSAYVFLTPATYYPILLTPLLVVGFHSFFDPHCTVAPGYERHVWTLLLVLGSLAVLRFHPLPRASTARAVMQSLDLQAQDLILISGSYGHEWQYESPAVVRRFALSLLPEAGAVICLEECPAFDRAGWHRQMSVREVWVR